MTPDSSALRIQSERLCGKLDELGQVGALEGGGVCRLALTPADRAGRDLVVRWMRELGLIVTVDRIGNIVGERAGRSVGDPVMIGSHIDTVATGGIYDGNLGVLAGLEIIQCLNDAGIETDKPLAVAVFTNEEGARFCPDMMGSGVHQGSLDLETMLAVRGIDGTSVEEDLAAIGYAGDMPCGSKRAAAFLELHIEQGPILEKEGITIGAVEGVQGISWTEYLWRGTSNHAGTTPMHLRNDAGYAATDLAVFVRCLALEQGGDQVATVGSIELRPNLVNVIPNHARMTVDLRNTDDEILTRCERQTLEYAAGLAQREGLELETRTLARFAPVSFDQRLVAMVENHAKELGHSVRRLPSGAGHDAQMFAPNCPTAMIFVPSQGGISHNIREHTSREDLQAGGNVLLRMALELAGK
jgi:N-carbamoyl-L-amino-acid hydrolase